MIKNKATGKPVYIGCPHCRHSLTEAELRTMLGKFARASHFVKPANSRFAKMTPDQRSEAGRQAAKARWANRETPI